MMRGGPLLSRHSDQPRLTRRPQQRLSRGLVLLLLLCAGCVHGGGTGKGRPHGTADASQMIPAQPSSGLGSRLQQHSQHARPSAWRTVGFGPQLQSWLRRRQHPSAPSDAGLQTGGVAAAPGAGGSNGAQRRARLLSDSAAAPGVASADAPLGVVYLELMSDADGAAFPAAAPTISDAAPPPPPDAPPPAAPPPPDTSPPPPLNAPLPPVSQPAEGPAAAPVRMMTGSSAGDGSAQARDSAPVAAPMTIITPAPSPQPTPVPVYVAPAPSPASTPIPVSAEPAAAPSPAPTPVPVYVAPAPSPAPTPVPVFVEPAAAPSPALTPVPIILTSVSGPAPSPSGQPTPEPVAYLEPAAAPSPAQPTPVPVDVAPAPSPVPTPVPVYEAPAPSPVPTPVPVEAAAPIAAPTTPVPVAAEAPTVAYPSPSPIPAQQQVEFLLHCFVPCVPVELVPLGSPVSVPSEMILCCVGGRWVVS